jgi:AraC-like DNA-binding protein
MANSVKDSVRIWCPEGVQGLELMDANVLEHRWPKHFHDAYTIGFNLGGAGSFFCQGSVQRPVPGCLHLINPQEIHTGQALGDHAWRYRSILLSPDSVASLTEQVAGRSQPLWFCQPLVRDERLATSLSQLFEALDRKPGCECTDRLGEETLALRTLGRVMRKYAGLRDGKIGSDRRIVQRIKTCLQDQFSRPITLQELAAIANLTPHHLIAVFQQEVGVPPHAYLNLVRVSRAKGLLSQGKPIAQVALECGYFDQSHLNRWFQRIYAVTPRQYQSAGLSSKKPRASRPTLEQAE